MKRPANIKSRPGAFAWLAPGLWSVAGAFFILYYLYAWLRIEPALWYHSSAPVFLLDASFFSRFLAHPGGMAEYAGAFAAQLNYYDWLGALFWTLAAGLAFLATRDLLRRTTSLPVRVAPFGPPFLLLLLQGFYDTTTPAISTGWLAALGLGLGYAALPWTSTWRRLIACWVGAGALFCLAGFWPCLLFVTIGSLLEIVTRRQRLLGLGCLLVMLAVGLWIFGFSETPASDLMKPPGRGWASIAALAMYFFVPLAMLGYAFLSRSLSTVAPDTTQTKVAQASVSRSFRTNRPHGYPRMTYAGLFLLGWMLVWLAFDQQRKDFIRIRYYADQKQWARALSAGAKIKQVNTLTEIHLMRALYHTGRLAEDLFSFPLPNGFDLLPGLEAGLNSCRVQSEVLLELGQLNPAEHYAHEALEYEGERAEVLLLLARIHVLKGRPQAARVFLNVLARVPFQREKAEIALRRLEGQAAGADNQDSTEIRTRLVTTDQPSNAAATEDLLQQLLQANPRNRMAFEYLMAHWLLTLQFDKVVTALGRLAEFGYTNIPRHCEEAVLFYQQRRGGPPPDLHGLRLRPETSRRFGQFLESVNRGAVKTPEGRQALLRDFGDTYWLYHLSQEAQAKPAASPSLKP